MKRFSYKVIILFCLSFRLYSFDYFKEQFEKAKEKAQEITDQTVLKTFQKSFEELQAQLKQLAKSAASSLDPAQDAKAAALFNKILDQQQMVLDGVKKFIPSVVYTTATKQIEDLRQLGFIEFIKQNIVEQLQSIWKLNEKQQAIVNANNPYKNQTAKVSKESGLPEHEKSYVAARSSITKKALESFLKRQLNDAQVPKIGIAYSGGGYRAMILSLGYSLGLQNVGLLEAATYMSTLSGSTWFCSKYLYAGSLEALKASDHAAIKAQQFDLLKMQEHTASHPSFLVNQVVWPKFLFQQPLTSIDVYGALLSDVLYTPPGSLEKPKYLSEQKKALGNGARVYPIYTVIRVRKAYDYVWFEITPDHVKPVEKSTWVPTWAFGRSFKDGVSTDFAPEQTMGYYAGTFGSAYTINFRDIKRLTLENIAKETPKKSLLEKVKYEVTTKVLKILADLGPISTVRALPAKFNNPWRGMTGYDFANRTYLEFIDAGIDYNIPLAPLMQKDRGLDLIIAADSSTSAATRSQLDNFFNYAKKQYGITYKRTDDNSVTNFGVYKPDKKAPIIVYINFVKDAKQFGKFANSPGFKSLVDTNKLSAFNNQTCDYCSTLNFNYTIENYNQLSGIGEFNIRANEGALRKVIEEIVAGKK